MRERDHVSLSPSILHDSKVIGQISMDDSISAMMEISPSRGVALYQEYDTVPYAQAEPGRAPYSE
jgi:hypothetical protein